MVYVVDMKPVGLNVPKHIRDMRVVGAIAVGMILTAISMAKKSPSDSIDLRSANMCTFAFTMCILTLD